MSKGEDKIVDILNRAGVRFIREKTFSDLKHGSFRFDFYIKNARSADCIIEYNGEQHYKFVKKFYKTQTEWRQAQGRDMRKISYCLANNIELYIIPYWEINNINNILDLFQPKFRALNRYKNFLDFEMYSDASQKNVFGKR